MQHPEKIKAVIFDMDGLLINSEPIWREAEKQVFKKAGIDLTDEMCFQTVGLRIDEVVEYWFQKYPWDGIPHQELNEGVIDKVIELVNKKGEALPGVYEVLDFFKSKNIPVAIASASSTSIIQSVISRLDIAGRFAVIHSAEYEDYGKPHPAVYLTAARMLKVHPYHCLVFEDSINGVIAARAARMKVVAVPEDIHFGEPHFAAAHAVLRSLSQFNAEVLSEMNLTL